MRSITITSLVSLVCCVYITNAVLLDYGRRREPQPEPHNKYADAAYDFIHNLKCEEAFFTTNRVCKHLTTLKKNEANIYIAGPSHHTRFQAVLPDGGLSKTGSHDVVLTLDPYPQANFGHLVLVFFVDLNIPSSICQIEGGKVIGNGECLRLALKRRCRNALERRGRRRNFARRCEINFLPLVYKTRDVFKTQHLECKSISGYSLCPTLRPKNETTGIICNPLRDNTHRCETTHATVQTSCRVFEICDQAVLVSGGWNRQMSLPRHQDNIVNMYTMLRKHGFKKNNINIFFANGLRDIKDGNEAHEVHPAAMKLALRYHLKKMCTSLYCVDSLFLYLNNPTKADGTMLLWDINGDGILRDNEKYTLEELLDDLQECAAKQVHLVVDQSYGGEIARAVSQSKVHQNVAVFSGSRENEYSWKSEYTKLWSEIDHTQKCSKQVFKETESKMVHSKPEMGEGLQNRVNTTIFGSPCSVFPPFSNRELRNEYFGCQNLPTALWIRKLVDSSQLSGERN